MALHSAARKRKALAKSRLNNQMPQEIAHPVSPPPVVGAHGAAAPYPARAASGAAFSGAAFLSRKYAK